MSIARVAKHANVSTATVSRVLNHVPGVSERTAEAVWNAVGELKFDVLQVRRGPTVGSKRNPLVRPRTGIIAAVMLGISRDVLRFPVMNAVIEGIRRASKDSGYRLLLDEILDPFNPGRSITRREVDGVIAFMLGAAPVESLAALSEHVPVVWAMGAHVGPLQVDHVTSDNLSVGHIAFAYLRQQGCADIAFVGPNPEWRFVRQRAQGMATAALEAQQRIHYFLRTENPLLAESYGRHVTMRPDMEQLADAIVQASPRPTGIFVETDRDAAVIYPLLIQRNFLPGRDVKIISCDNEHSRLSALFPRPASIDLDTDELGRRAVEQLLKRMSNRQAPPVSIQVVPRLAIES
jgi:DNA-binding LacI/PurR family transcriptional regulator